MSDAFKDRDGRAWQPFTNEYQQRKLRNIATGEVIDDPRLGAPPEPRKGPRIVDGIEPNPYGW